MSHPDFLLSCPTQAKNCRSKDKIKGKEKVSSESYQACLDSDHCVHLMLGTILGMYYTFHLHVVLKVFVGGVYVQYDETFLKFLFTALNFTILN